MLLLRPRQSIYHPNSDLTLILVMHTTFNWLWSNVSLFVFVLFCLSLFCLGFGGTWLCLGVTSGGVGNYTPCQGLSVPYLLYYLSGQSFVFTWITPTAKLVPLLAKLLRSISKSSFISTKKSSTKQISPWHFSKIFPWFPTEFQDEFWVLWKVVT